MSVVTSARCCSPVPRCVAHFSVAFPLRFFGFGVFGPPALVGGKRICRRQRTGRAICIEFPCTQVLLRFPHVSRQIERQMLLYARMVCHYCCCCDVVAAAAAAAVVVATVHAI